MADFVPPITRPVAVGDILTQWEGEAGARVVITLGQPTAHAPSGVDAPDACAIEGRLTLPGGDGGLAAPWYAPEIMVLAEGLHSFWGSPGEGVRVSTTRASGPALGPLLADVTATMRGAYDAARAVHDAHMASVARLEAERAAAYAAWPVAVEYSSPDGPVRRNEVPYDGWRALPAEGGAS